MDFKGPARALENKDVETVAGYLGCSIASVRAVLAIESTGRGFENWRPLILNEPHWFYRLVPPGKLARAVDEGLAYKRQGASPYPRTQEARYAWLDKAMRIDEDAALKSCSWGLGQVMGFNHEACGFSTVKDFVNAMKMSEGAQLLAMARFIVANGLQRHMRSLNWSSFARGYNGPAYAKHGYHTKLRKAYYARPSSERRTPPPPSADDMERLAKGGTEPPAPPETTPMPPDWSPNHGIYLQSRSQGPRVAELIRDLHALGFYKGALDDYFWTATETAVRGFQAEHGLRVDGVAGPVTLDKIDEILQKGHQKVAAAVETGSAAGAALASGAALAFSGSSGWLGAVLFGLAVGAAVWIIFFSWRD